MVEFRLSHIGYLTDKVQEAAAFYCRQLGMLVVGTLQEPGMTEIAFLADRGRSDFCLELHGPPWLDELEAEIFAGRGPWLDHLHFWVPDVLQAYHRLRLEGCRSRLEPMNFLGGWEAAVYDPQGVEIWLRREGEEGQHKAIANARKKVADEGSPAAAELHHIGILTPDPKTSIAFYTQVMGLAIKRQIYQPGHLDVTFLQIEGPPHLPYEEDHLAKYGPEVNHIHFAVKDVDTAYRMLVDQGAREHMAPECIEDARHALLYDPQGIDLQILHFPPEHDLA